MNETVNLITRKIATGVNAIKAAFSPVDYLPPSGVPMPIFLPPTVKGEPMPIIRNIMPPKSSVTYLPVDRRPIQFSTSTIRAVRQQPPKPFTPPPVPVLHTRCRGRQAPRGWQWLSIGGRCVIVRRGTVMPGGGGGNVPPIVLSCANRQAPRGWRWILQNNQCVITPR